MNKLFILLAILTFSINSFSQIPKKPNPPKLVNDFVGILTQDEVATLERKLVSFDDSTKTQIVIVIVDDLGDYDRSQFAFEIGNTWGVGDAKFDNGIVILVKPIGGQGQRRTFIATGYGLEGIIPDAVTKRIVDNEMLPYFQNDQYFKGLDNATNVLMSLAVKEFSAGDYTKKIDSRAQKGSYLFILIILIVILSRMFSTRSYARSNNIPFWTALFLMNSAGRHSGSYGNFNSGGGSFGGFGGFGGGGFGGGGAGGSW